MDFLRIIFPASGVETYIFIPPLISFVISFFGAMGGISGAFLILPFQMSVLGFTAPSVSSTNFLYNVVGIPGGVYRYIREGRMSWPLTWVIISGTLPGVLIGYLVRVKYLPDPGRFKLFAGSVLLYVGLRLLSSTKEHVTKKGHTDRRRFKISDSSYGIKKISYTFMGERLSFGVPAMFTLAFVVGIIGGIYGIGGGAIIAPFCVTFFRLPVYTVAGAALMGTFITSISGVLFYSTIPLADGLTAPPDWLLGFLFGIGGLFGMYLGARIQKHMPERFIKLLLSVVILVVALRYIVQFFW